MKKITRRAFIKAAVTSGIALAGGSLLTGCGDNSGKVAEKFTADLDVKHLRQIVTADPATSRCIMWQTDSAMELPAVEVKLKNSNDVMKVTAVDSSFTDDGEKIFQYTAQISNLTPDANYEYRIIDGDHSTGYHKFDTMYNERIKAIIFPDSQCADYNVWGEVANAAFKRNPDAEFFVNVGDIVDNGEDSSQWQTWMNEIEDNLKIYPFVPVMGNHETYSRDWQVRLPVAYLNYFAVPDNGVEDFSRRFYSFDCGAAHFVVLDSQWDELEQFTPNLIQTQREWLYNDIEKSSKTWKVAFIHKDVLQYRIRGRGDRYEGFSDIGINLMPDFEALGFDVVFTAHLHTYRNRGRLKNFDADDTGPLYILTGLSGDVRYPNLWENHALDVVVAPQPETDNYLTLEVDDKILTVRCFLPDGNLIDEISLSKE